MESLVSPPDRSLRRRLNMKLRTLSTTVQSYCFSLGSLTTAQLFLAHQPDSYSSFVAHPEFDTLVKRFTAYNRRNNGGDIARLWSLILNTKQILSDGIAGDFAEVGVWRGNSAAVLAHFARESGRSIFLFDTFTGFSEDDLTGIDADKQRHFADTSLELVRGIVGGDAETCHFVPGYFPGSITPGHAAREYAVVSLDCDLYAPLKAGLDFFYERMARGGAFFLHDYSSLHWAGAKAAIDEFCRRTGELPILLPDKSGSVVLRKTK